MKLHTWDHHVSRGSSPVDWCEPNYTSSPVIAEFVNTISNILFLIIPPFLVHLHQPYARLMGSGIQVIWFMLVVIGVCSAYFHATLSLLGQLLDEISVLWANLAGFALWYPKVLMPPCLRDNGGRKKFIYFVLLFSTITTFLGMIEPSINAFVLLTLGVPSASMMVYKISREENIRVMSLGKRCLYLWIAAVLCWISDRFSCNMWTRIGFPYLHGLWHILIFLASYKGVVLYAYYDMENMYLLDKALIRYWPSDNFECGLPYVHFKNAYLIEKQH